MYIAFIRQYTFLLFFRLVTQHCLLYHFHFNHVSLFMSSEHPTWSAKIAPCSTTNSGLVTFMTATATSVCQLKSKTIAFYDWSGTRSNLHMTGTSRALDCCAALLYHHQLMRRPYPSCAHSIRSHTWSNRAMSLGHTPFQIGNNLSGVFGKHDQSWTAMKII